MDRWLFGGLAHGAAVGGLRRIGRHAAGHRSLCRAASRLGGRDVGRFYAPVHWPLCPDLRSHQRLPHWLGTAQQCAMGQLGHLVGLVGRWFAIVDGRASLWLACEPHQLTRHDGFYTSGRPLDHGVTVACTHRLASRRLI